MCTRQTLFPQQQLLPQHHYLLHYADLTWQFGPLIRFWTMRFESKHKFFEQCLKKSQNFKNVSKTLSERHQLLQAYLAGTSVINDQVRFENMHDLDLSVYSDAIKSVIEELDLNLTNACICQSVNMKGTEYRNGMFVVLEANDMGLVLAKIMMLLVLNASVAEIYFVVEAYQSERLVNMGIHCINAADNFLHMQCLRVDSFLDYYPLHKYDVGNLWLLPLHHAMPSVY